MNILDLEICVAVSVYCKMQIVEVIVPKCDIQIFENLLKKILIRHNIPSVNCKISWSGITSILSTKYWVYVFTALIKYLTFWMKLYEYKIDIKIFKSFKSCQENRERDGLSP